MNGIFFKKYSSKIEENHITTIGRNTADTSWSTQVYEFGQENMNFKGSSIKEHEFINW
jgi:hypothetical protein